MWPLDRFTSDEEDEPEYYCDEQPEHDWVIHEEMEARYLSRYYDAQEEAEVVVIMTIPKLAECEVCGECIENDMREWEDHGSFTRPSDYEIKFTKVVVNDCSDARRIDATNEFT